MKGQDNKMLLAYREKFTDEEKGLLFMLFKYNMNNDQVWRIEVHQSPDMTQDPPEKTCTIN